MVNYKSFKAAVPSNALPSPPLSTSASASCPASSVVPSPSLGSQLRMTLAIKSLPSFFLPSFHYARARNHPHLKSANSLDFWTSFFLVTFTITQPLSLCLLFGNHPPPPIVDVICTCPPEQCLSPFNTSEDGHGRLGSQSRDATTPTTGLELIPAGRRCS